MHHTNAEATTPPAQNEYDAAHFERPSVTVDIVMFTIRHNELHVLLIRRKEWPFEGYWALPGGFVRPHESPDDAARRELAEETGVRDIYLQQLRVFGDPGRDPRTWVITIAFTALMPSDRTTLSASADAADAQWFALSALPPQLAFDHAAILSYATGDLRTRVQNQGALVSRLLPTHFTLTQMQSVYEILLAGPLDKRNFRKWALSSGTLVTTDQEVRGRHRPALLYTFIPDAQTAQSNVILRGQGVVAL